MASNLIQKTHPQSRRPSVIVVTSCDVTFYVVFFENTLYKEIDIFKILTKYPSVALKIESVIRRTIVEPPPSCGVSHTHFRQFNIYIHIPILILFVEVTQSMYNLDCGNTSV